MNAFNDSSHQTRCTTVSITWFVIYAVQGIFTLLGNVLTMMVFWRRRRVLKRASYLLINLAVDTLVGISMLLVIVPCILRCAISFGNMTVAFGAINLVCMSASMLSLACIALERVFAFVRPLVHRAATATRCYHYTVGLVWFVAALFCALILGALKFNSLPLRPDEKVLRLARNNNWLGCSEIFFAMNASNDTVTQASGSIPTVWGVVFGIEGLLTLLGNLLTIAVFWRRKNVFKRATYLLINLAMADCLVGLFNILCLGRKFLTNGSSHLERVVTKTFLKLSMTFVGASILWLTCIALEKAFAFVKPIRHRTTKTRSYYYVVCSVWIFIGVLCAFAVLDGFVISVPLLGDLVALCTYGTCLMAIAISHIIIWWALSKRPAPEVLQRKQNRKVATTLSALTLLSLATFLPGEIYFIFVSISEHSASNAALLAFGVVNGNSLVNPFVYVWRMPTFRREVLSLFNCKRRCYVHPKEANTPPIVHAGGVALVKFQRRNSLQNGRL